MQIETYQMISSNGRPIRKATKVILLSGRQIKFTESLSKDQAIAQAFQVLKNECQHTWNEAA